MEETKETEDTVSHGATEQRRRAEGDCTPMPGSAVVTPVTALRAVWIEQPLAHKPAPIDTGL